MRIPFTVLVLAMLPAVLGRYRGGDLLYTRFAVTDTRVRIQGQAAIVVGVQEQQGRFRGLPADARLRLTLNLTGVDENDPQISGVHLSPMEAPPAPPITTFTPEVLLRSEETGDQVAVIENRVPPRWGGPPLHHHDFDETFYVLDGELTFQLDDELLTSGPGAIAFAARGAYHTLANLSEAPARYLLICTPGGFERYFDGLTAEAAGTEPQPKVKPYPETIVVGPPIDADAARSTS